MSARPLLSVLSLLAATLIGCGASASSANEHDVNASDVAGVYRSDSDGAIGAIAFRDGDGYMLMPTGCHAEACTELGTYALDLARTTLSLTDEKSGRTRTLPLTVLVITPTKTVKPQDMVTPTPPAKSGATLLEPSASVTDGSTVAIVSAIELLRLQEQKLRRDVTPDNTQTGPLSPQTYDPCTTDTPTPHTSADARSVYWTTCPKGI